MLTSNKSKVFILVVMFGCLICTVTFAQGPGFGDDVVDTPIDGGALFVAAAVVGYGAKRVAEKRK